jgi:hypothetical protein
LPHFALAVAKAELSFWRNAHEPLEIF